MADIVSAVQIPRAIVFINGVAVIGLLSYSVDNNSFYQADTFNFEVSLDAQVAPFDANWWSLQTEINVEIYGGYPSNPNNFTKADLVLELSGKSDDIEMDYLARTIIVTGRDLTRLMIDTKRAESFITQPLQPSNVVKQIADSVGLKSEIEATELSVGAYTQIVKSIVESNATLWDIVCKLAQIVGYVAYVQGDTLYFHAREKMEGKFVFTWNPATSLYNSPTFNGTSLKFGRNGQAARDIKVTVMSTSVKGKHVITATAQKTRVKSKTAVRGSTDSGDAAVNYTFFSKYARTQDEAQAFANSKLKELSLHEMRMEVGDMPADPALNARKMIQVNGTNTAYDQDYYPSSIVKSFSPTQGYTMTVHAKNTSPDVEFSQ